MLKYLFEEIPNNSNEIRSAKMLDEKREVKSYESTLEPKQTILAYANLKEFRFYGCEALTGLNEIADKTIEITLEDFDYANGKVRTVVAKGLEAMCPHCNHNQLLSGWRRKEDCDESPRSAIANPAEIMPVPSEKNCCLNGLRVCGGVDTFANPISADELIGFELLLLFKAFIEGGGKRLVIRYNQDRTKSFPHLNGTVDPFDHPSIRYQNDSTVRFGSTKENLKALYTCHNCGEAFFAICNPSESDKENITRFQPENHTQNVQIPRSQDAQIPLVLYC